jgi:DNA modification methylase
LRDYQVSGQLGLEPTPDEYIANLVAVFRECKRILRDDGTLWVNIGDSYGGSKSGGRNDTDRMYPGSPDGLRTSGIIDCQTGVKPKDLIGIPWMLAFALRADGWYLRSDIIWAKRNCMPEPVKDRPTKSHEYIFLLSKSSKYYYDNEAVKEPVENMGKPRAFSKPGNGDRNDVGRIYEPQSTRNKRDVWWVSTKPYKGAHYATFNPELITPCILAGAPEGGIVFDPFVGSGTTVATAIQLGRRGVGIDLSMKYLLENAKERIDDVRLPLLENTWK